MEARRQAVKDSHGGEVFTGNHFQTGRLASLLLPDDFVDLWVQLAQRLVHAPVAVAGVQVGSLSSFEVSCTHSPAGELEMQKKTSQWFSSVPGECLK